MGRFVVGLAVLFVVALTSPVRGSITWDWSFASEAGQYETDGTLSAGGAAPNTYRVLDFSVTSSATGGTLGSLRGGQYTTRTHANREPYYFVWDGSGVTQWLHSGSNLFDWHVYEDATATSWPPGWYFFGWDIGNINDPTSGAHQGWTTLAQGTISVSPAGVIIPEPSAFLIWCLLAVLGIGCARWRRKR